MSVYRFQIERSTFESLGPTQTNSRSVYDFFDDKKLSSTQRLFFKLWSSNKVYTTVLEPDKTILRAGEVPDTGFLILAGEAYVAVGDDTLILGPGSAIGIAEGLCDLPMRASYVSKTALTVKVIPMPNVIRELSQANPGLKGICRLTAKRILDDRLKDIPAQLRAETNPRS